MIRYSIDVVIVRIFIFKHIFVRPITFCLATTTTTTTTTTTIVIMSVLITTVITLGVVLIPLLMVARLLRLIFEKLEFEVPFILHYKYIPYSGS